ncbi:NUDIX hydrolase [Spongiibacter sp. IMCC21906]|uniref:NUDIX hydrolase n=1 Tax=Spongiibacter sp. IMCC21906 TaxID=1620392 RepID=UPI0009E4A9A9|nr:NUDIX hydrolase [Spongiibacter sp. IMCC21906]
MMKKREQHRVAVIIKHHNDYLVCQLPGKTSSSKWEFPGDHIRDGEALSDAARRIAEKKLGMSVSKVGDVVFAADEAFVPLKESFFEVDATGPVNAPAYTDSAWCSLDDLLKLDMWLLDKTVVDILRNGSH